MRFRGWRRPLLPLPRLLRRAASSAATSAIAAQQAAANVPTGGGSGGNAYTITDATAQRLNPATGAALPAGAVVTWITATRPTNIADGDFWLQTN